MTPLLILFGLVAVVVVVCGAIAISRRKNAGTLAGSGASDEKAGALEAGQSVEIEPLTDFNWEETEPRKHRPFKPIYHITMAIKNDTPSDLIVIDSNYKDRVEHRKSIIASHQDVVLGTVPEGVAPARELYTYLLSEYLPTRYPDMFTLTSTSSSTSSTEGGSDNHQSQGQRILNHVTGRHFSTTPPEDTLELFKVLGETVEDDLLLLVDTPEGHRMVSFVCCFPNGFDPKAKLGLVLRQIHVPVPSYEKIGPSMERFFARLEVGQVVKRTNWSVTTHTELFSPDMNHVYKGDTFMADEDVDIENARVRVEFQALSRLPKTNSVLFSFKTYLYPLKEIKAEGLGPEFADAIEGLKAGNAPEMWTYKGAVRWGKSVLEYLRAP